MRYLWCQPASSVIVHGEIVKRPPALVLSGKPERNSSSLVPEQYE